MPTGSVRLQSIKKLGHENQSYEFSDEGKSRGINVHITDDLLHLNHQQNGPGVGLPDLNAFSFLLCRTRRLLHVSSEHSMRHFKSDVRL